MTKLKEKCKRKTFSCKDADIIKESNHSNGKNVLRVTWKDLKHKRNTGMEHVYN